MWVCHLFALCFDLDRISCGNFDQVAEIRLGRLFCDPKYGSVGVFHATELGLTEVGWANQSGCMLNTLHNRMLFTRETKITEFGTIKWTRRR